MRGAIILAVAVLVTGEASAEEILGARRTLETREIKAAVAAAPGGKERGVRLCRFSAYSRDTSPTNLRAAPRADAKILATLPPMRKEAGTTIGAQYQVIAGKDGWFLIRGAHWSGYDLDEKPLVLGPVWMAANLSSLTIENPALQREPREEAETVLKLRPLDGATDNWGSDSVKVERIFGCSGSFVDVAVLTPDGRRARGWASGICSNQVTTCGGGHMLVEERAGGLYRSETACRGSAGVDCPRP